MNYNIKTDSITSLELDKVSNIFNEKRKYSKKLQNFFRFKTNNKVLWLIIVKDKEEVNFLIEGLEILSCNFIIKTENEIQERINLIKTNQISDDLFYWADFFVTDNEMQGLNKLFSFGITPIIPNNNYLSSILKEYNPISNSWNCFIYENKNKWSMYYAIIRYLENYKFPFDNRTLVKNVLSMSV